MASSSAIGLPAGCEAPGGTVGRAVRTRLGTAVVPHAARSTVRPMSAVIGRRGTSGMVPDRGLDAEPVDSAVMDRTAKPGTTIDDASIAPARPTAIGEAVASIWAPVALVVAALA